MSEPLPPPLPPEHGAEERLDPFATLSPFSVDHLARYALAAEAVAGKRVLDAATGTGFGAWLLARAGASAIDAVDLDEGALSTARERYGHDAIRFFRADLDTFEGMPAGPWDVVTCFETLEHLPDPERFLKSLRDRLAPEARLFLSVPGEADAEADNPYHLHHFDRAAFTEMVQRVFPEAAVTVLAQRLSVAAEFRSQGDMAPATCAELPLDSARPAADGYLAIVGPDQPVAPRLWHSPAVWSALMEERERIYAESKDFAEKYRELFAQHSDLREKFSVCLAWGTYHHHQNTQQNPPEDFLAPLQAETFDRNNTLQAELSAARKRIAELEKEVETARAFAPGGTADRCKEAARRLVERDRPGEET